MKILVTGATSGLGRNCVNFLLEKNIDVVGIGRNVGVGEELSAKGVNFYAIDIRDIDNRNGLEILADVDAIWHCAALSSPWGKSEEFNQHNIQATINLLNIARKANVKRFIHISTPAIYFDYQHHFELDELFRAKKPANDYARTKLEAEQQVLMAANKNQDMHYTIIRPRAIFGPYDRVLLPRLLTLLKQNNGKLPLPRAGKTVIDMTFVGNVVHSMWLATNSTSISSGNIFNITNDEPAKIINVLEKLFVHELNYKMQVKNIPYPIAAIVAKLLEMKARFTKKEPKLTSYSAGVLAFDMTLSIERAKRVLGYKPVFSLDEGIKLTAKWLRENDNG
jgi:nucleoside-diphosphate-sugar epimerase